MAAGTDLSVGPTYHAYGFYGVEGDWPPVSARSLPMICVTKKAVNPGYFQVRASPDMMTWLYDRDLSNY